VFVYRTWYVSLFPDPDLNKNVLRPRSQRAHDKVLDAAIELFAERGIDGTSVDAIAALSGVSKATIYKHWADKQALCLEALGHVFGLDRPRSSEDTEDLLADIVAFLKSKPPEETNEVREKLMPYVIAYSAHNKEFGRAWRAKVMQPGKARAIQLMERGKSSGVFSEDLDHTVGLALLIGPMMYKHIFHESDPPQLAEQVAGAFWRAFRKQ
jgi:AcrR family transcriptional regulator